MPTTRRILIADDDPIIRHLVTRLTANEGLQPVVVNDGGAAIVYYRLTPIFVAQSST